MSLLLLKELASAITKLHLDLLTHLDSPSLLPLEELKLKVEDLQVKCHMLSYKAEGNEMLLKVLLVLRLIDQICVYAGKHFPVCSITSFSNFIKEGLTMVDRDDLQSIYPIALLRVG